MMRYIFLMMMLTGMLFSSGQRQIIVGSFSVESNALFYSLDVQKKINEDDKLQSMMEKYSLKMDYKVVGDYSVVTIYPFENYPSLFETIAVLKEHYPKAYSIRYPAFAEALEVEKVVEEEVIEEEVVLVQPKAVVVEAVVEPEPEIKYEVPSLKKPIPLPTPVVNQEEQLPMMDLILLIVLLLVIIGFIIYKRKKKKIED